MTPKHRTRMTYLSILATIIIFACQAGAADPTATPLPAPTAVPTNTAEAPTPEPTDVPAPTEAPAVPPTTGENIITIDQVHGFFDIYDSLNVVGLVTNNTTRAVDNIEIEVEIFDANDVSLYVDTIYVDLFALLPGETSPFSIYVFEDLPDADNFVATVVGNSATEIERATLDVANTIMAFDDDGNIHITGELTNNTNDPVDINSLAAAVFDGAGEIVASDSYNSTIRYLDPGESGPFRVTITGPNTGTADITDFQLYLDAEYTDAVGPFNIEIGDAIYYFDTFDNLHLVGQLTNQSDMTWNIRLVAGIYDAEGNVVDVAHVDLPINALAPGESSPYDFDFWGALDSTVALQDQVASYTYSIQVDAYWTWDTDTELLDLATANDTNEFDDFGGEFNGQVVNNTGGLIDSVVVIVYLVDKETNTIVAVDYTYLFEEIQDGASLDYTVYMDPKEGFDINTAEYYIVVKGERPQ
ncbi:MAG: hypothetical protein HC806_01315 [Anaerolineae bacterium]|nr:hypothetical protein [Anaerolineae bacterium]